MSVARRFLLVILLLGPVLFAGCGPVITTSFTYRWEDVDKEQLRDLGYVSIENVKLDPSRLPPSITTRVPRTAKNQQGELVYVVASDKSLFLDEHSVFPPGTSFYGLTITNKTDHVIRLTSAVIRLFDPAGSDYSPITKQDLSALWDDQFPPSYPLATADRTSYALLQKSINNLKLVTPQVELLPNVPFTGYLAFQPNDPQLTGVWKLSIYDIPVEVDPAGIVKKTVKTEFNSSLEKWKYTYEAKNMMSKKELRGKEKVE